MSLTGRKGNRFSPAGRQRDSNSNHSAPELRSMESCAGNKGTGKTKEKRVVVPPLGITVLSQCGSIRPITPSNSHYIFRTLLLTISAVICIWVNIPA